MLTGYDALYCLPHRDPRRGRELTIARAVCWRCADPLGPARGAPDERIPWPRAGLNPVRTGGD
ncbi:hypothetical protein HBB16_10175 [Pseudonocardia sp. MCCB 268]|nr:hypothetical protein [Pseudonocardia cytotoxica]